MGYERRRPRGSALRAAPRALCSGPSDLHLARDPRRAPPSAVLIVRRQGPILRPFSWFNNPIIIVFGCVDHCSLARHCYRALSPPAISRRRPSRRSPSLGIAMATERSLRRRSGTGDHRVDHRLPGSPYYRAPSPSTIWRRGPYLSSPSFCLYARFPQVCSHSATRIAQ